MQDTYLIRTLLPLFDLAEERGLDRRQLLEVAGASPALLADPDARAPVVRMVETYRFLAERIDDPDFGLTIGARYRVENLGLVGYLMRNSSTLHGALERLVRYRSLITETLEVELVSSRDSVEIVETPDIRLGSLRHLCDDYLGSALTIARQLTDQDLVPLQAVFYYPRPAAIDRHQELFRCPLRFGARRGRLVFARQDIEAPVPGADSGLLVYLDRHADDVIAELGAVGSLSERVQRCLWSRISAGEQPTLENVARQLAMSERTLQRRLRVESATFGGLVESFRSNLARSLLQDRNLAIYEVAYLLGYSEPSAFNRAFRRWSGRSPRQFRARETAAG